MKLGRTRVLAGAAAFWTLFGVVCALQIWLSMLEHNHSLVRLIALPDRGLGRLGPRGHRASARLARLFPVVPPSSRNLLVHLLCGVIVGVLHSAWWVALSSSSFPTTA